MGVVLYKLIGNVQYERRLTIGHPARCSRDFSESSQSQDGLVPQLCHQNPFAFVTQSSQHRRYVFSYTDSVLQ